MLRIWGRTNSINVQKVMWTVGELNLEYARYDAGGKFGGLDTEEYGQMNPNRRVPTLQDEDAVIWESNAIVRYLAARYGADTMWPSDPAARADSDRWMDWTITTLMGDLNTVFRGLIRTPPAERDMTEIEAAQTRMNPNWDILERHLSGRPFIAGDRLTIGDIPTGAACYRYTALDIERPERPNLEAWYKRLTQRPAFHEHVMIPLS
jgi:glutathione S-transferase